MPPNHDIVSDNVRNLSLSPQLRLRGESSEYIQTMKTNINKNTPTATITDCYKQPLTSF